MSGGPLLLCFGPRLLFPLVISEVHMKQAVWDDKEGITRVFVYPDPISKKTGHFGLPEHASRDGPHIQQAQVSRPGVLSRGSRRSDNGGRRGVLPAQILVLRFNEERSRLCLRACFSFVPILTFEHAGS